MTAKHAAKVSTVCMLHEGSMRMWRVLAKAIYSGPVQATLHAIFSLMLTSEHHKVIEQVISMPLYRLMECPNLAGHQICAPAQCSMAMEAHQLLSAYRQQARAHL